MACLKTKGYYRRTGLTDEVKYYLFCIKILHSLAIVARRTFSKIAYYLERLMDKEEWLMKVTIVPIILLNWLANHCWQWRDDGETSAAIPISTDLFALASIGQRLPSEVCMCPPITRRAFPHPPPNSTELLHVSRGRKDTSTSNSLIWDDGGTERRRRYGCLDANDSSKP